MFSINQDTALYLGLDKSVKGLQIDPLSSSNSQRSKSAIIVALYNTTKVQLSFGYLSVADQQTLWHKYITSKEGKLKWNKNKAEKMVKLWKDLKSERSVILDWDKELRSKPVRS